MTKRGLFLQYSVKSLIDVFAEFINQLSIGKAYTKQELSNVYKELKGYESIKTKNIFLNKILEAIFSEFNTSTDQNQLNHWGILARRNHKDLSILKLIIYLNSFKKAYIFELECEIIYDFVELYNDAPISNKSFIDITIRKLRIILKDTKSEGKEKNAREKFSLVNSSLSQIGVIKKLERKNYLNLKYINPDWRVFTLYLFETYLPDIKISITKLIKESKVKKHLFMKEQEMMSKLIQLEDKGFINIENTAGVDQIHLNFNSLDKVINEIGK